MLSRLIIIFGFVFNIWPIRAHFSLYFFPFFLKTISFVSFIGTIFIPCPAPHYLIHFNRNELRLISLLNLWILFRGPFERIIESCEGEHRCTIEWKKVSFPFFVRFVWQLINDICCHNVELSLVLSCCWLHLMKTTFQYISSSNFVAHYTTAYRLLFWTRKIVTTNILLPSNIIILA